MKLTTITNVSVDGVMQGLGGPNEDRRGGFDRGGWALPLFEAEAERFLGEIYQRADAFLLGRRTYEIFAASWGTWADPGDSLIWTALNTRPKYVASTTLTDPQWSGTTVLTGDLASAVAELKAAPGGELQVHGSGVLVRWLLEHRLVDELTLLVCPVVLGQGTRLFPARRGCGHGTRPGGVAVHPTRSDDPGLPAHGPPGVRVGRAEPEYLIPRRHNAGSASAQGRSASSWVASASRVASPPSPATNCTPSGSPSAVR